MCMDVQASAADASHGGSGRSVFRCIPRLSLTPGRGLLHTPLIGAAAGKLEIASLVSGRTDDSAPRNDEGRARRPALVREVCGAETGYQLVPLQPFVTLTAPQERV